MCILYTYTCLLCTYKHIYIHIHANQTTKQHPKVQEINHSKQGENKIDDVYGQLKKPYVHGNVSTIFVRLTWEKRKHFAQHFNQ